MKAYYIPNGPKNLAPIFPAITFSKVEEYYVQVKDTSSTIIASGTMNKIGGECCTDKTRLHFVNYLGGIDAVNFKTVSIEHEAKSDSTHRGTSFPLVKNRHSVNRTNVRANDILTLSCSDYLEQDNKWLNELLDSPMVWSEWKGIQGQADDYIPVIILDSKMLNLKQEDRYVYELILQVRLSNERYIIRN